MGSSGKDSLGLGWYHRVLTRCCCKSHHPHLAQDKLILIQNETIINRNIMYDLSLLKKELDKMKQRKLERELSSGSEYKEETESLRIISDKVLIDKPNNLPKIKQAKQNKFNANKKREKKETNNDKYFGGNNKKQKKKKKKKKFTKKKKKKKKKKK